MAPVRFGSGKEAISYLFGRSEAPPPSGKTRAQLDAEIEEALEGPKATKAPKARAPSKPRAKKAAAPARRNGNGGQTPAQFIAALPPALSLRGPGSVRRAEIYKTIRAQLAAAIAAGALPGVTKISVTSDHNSLHVDVSAWTGQVFTNAYLEHLMDPKGTPWEREQQEKYRGDYEHRTWDPRLVEPLNRALQTIEKIANRHNYNNSDLMTDYFDVGYYLHVGARPVIDAAEHGIKTESDQAYQKLLADATIAARAVGPAATKAICGSKDLRGADQWCLDRLIKLAESAAGRPVEYSKSGRGWYPVKEVATSGPPIKLGKTEYRVTHGSREEGVFQLLGPGGGMSTLIRSSSSKQPALWAHTKYGGGNRGATWYWRDPDGSFTAT
jgi:hypothetical protein